MTRVIADNNLDICHSELHGILHSCLSNQYESSIDDVGFGGGPSADGTDIDPIDFSMDNYLRLLDDEEFVGACLMGEGISYSDEDISEDDVELICAIKQFFPEDNVQEIRSILNANCGPTSGVECKYVQLYCLDRLRDFKERYGVEMSYAELEEIAGGACNASDEDYDDEVISIIIDNTIDFDLDDPNSLPNRGQYIKLLDCSSFDFVQVGNSWMSCLDPNIMDVSIGSVGSPVHFSIDLGGFSFTMPVTRYNNQTFSQGEVASCAATASNLASLAVKSVIRMSGHRANSPTTHFFAKKVYQEAWDKVIKRTSCGYGKIGSCALQNCPNGTSPAIYSDDFFEVTEESLLGECF